MKTHIYADNAATTKLDKEAFDAMVPWLTEEYGNPSQPYSFSRTAKKTLADARETIAACINADPDEIFFTSGGTESDNWAIKGCAFSNYDGRATITSAFEHHAVLRSCETIERLGYPVAYIWPNRNGIITPDTLKSSITDKTILVSVMYVNNEIGTIQPIQELCEIAHSHNALFHTDAVQAVGHTEIDVKKIDIDLLSASAHKFNGPKGCGFLYVRRGIKLPSYADGGSQEFGMRAGTENIASIVGMATALKINVDNMEKNQKHIIALENYFINGLKRISVDYQRNGCNHMPGNISLSFKGEDGESLLHRLDLMGICVSTGAACDNTNTQISHVLKAINLDPSYANGTIRISLGKNNTVDDVDNILAALTKILNSRIIVKSK